MTKYNTQHSRENYVDNFGGLEECDESSPFQERWPWPGVRAADKR